MKKIALLLFFVVNTGFAQSVKFTLEDTKSVYRSYDEIKGTKLTVIDFWATWCKPCLQSIPHLISLQEEYKLKGVNFAGISVDGPRSVSKVSPLVESLKINYPVLLDFNSDIFRQYNINNLPSLVIINEKNKIVYFHEGYNAGDEKKLKVKIEELLNHP
ncbi:MAG: TlpA family protein disulfide reductase [Arcicella sp.]|nr:TlpA family protein disulfide reductase [Arcicella sp.]